MDIKTESGEIEKGVEEKREKRGVDKFRTMRALGHSRKQWLMVSTREHSEHLFVPIHPQFFLSYRVCERRDE